MRLIPSDPDIETLLRRIDDKEIDLQPDFQRGEVWSDRKKRLLVDSVLREWHIPPIHIVETMQGDEVLDGQQRLVAIRDFYKGKIRVDGHAQPVDDRICKFHNLTYHDIPEEYQRRFRRFGIRVFKIVDYSAEEAAELFYRLNQPVTLTAPEQRNAFFGPVRAGIRAEVERYPNVFDSRFLGFSNSRMAWDDVLARVCYSLEQRTLRSKITAGRLANRYREQEPFSNEVISLVENALAIVSTIRDYVDSSVRFNKATIFSWLYFFACSAEAEKVSPAQLGHLINVAETGRQKARQEASLPFDGGKLGHQVMSRLFVLFHDRATSRVGDVFSVLARDFVLWASAVSYSSELQLQPLLQANSKRVDSVTSIIKTVSSWSPTVSKSASDSASFEEVLEHELTEKAWGTRV